MKGIQQQVCFQLKIFMVRKGQHDFCKTKIIQFARTAYTTNDGYLSIRYKIHFLTFFRPIIIIPGYHKHITGIQLIFPIQYLCPYTFIIYISPFIGTANDNCFIHTVPFITSSKRIDQLSSQDHPYISKTQNPDFGKRITFILRYQFTKTGGIP